MLKSFLKTTLRNIRANKATSFINIFGLALGLAICLLITFYVTDELRFDAYNTQANRIFRVNTDVKSGPSLTSRAIAAPEVASALQNTFPGVEKTARLLAASERFKKGEELVQEDRMAYCDSSIFSIFTLPMIEGNPKTALQGPNSLVLTESAARKYFKNIHVLGQTLTTIGGNNAGIPHTITGVIRDIPEQSHFHFDFLLSMSPIQVSQRKGFGALFPFNTYLLLKPGTDYKKLEARLPAFVSKNAPFVDEMEKNGDYLKLSLTPLPDIHLHSNRTNELGANGDIRYVRIFSVVAVFVLLIACINFMNLATARSANRAREVGIRKVLGSSRKWLVVQFLGESMILTFLATLLAILAAGLLLPFFNQLSGKNLALSGPIVAWLFLLLFGISFTVGLLAGSYPAFFLSAFRPIAILHGNPSGGFKGGRLRNFLVVFQFSISVFLMIGTLVIYSQLRYIQKRSLGFTRQQVLVVKNMNALGNEAKTMKQEVKQMPGVVNATLSSFLPTGSRRWINYLMLPPSNMLETQFWPVDEDYLHTMDMVLVKGRDFSSHLSTDSSGMIINEKAAELMGYSLDPLDKKIQYGGNEKEYHIIGVVKDFNFSSLRENISPVVMMMMTPFERGKEGDGADNLCIRANTKDLPALLTRVKSQWKAFSPTQAFEYSFMDEDFDALYRSEQRMGQLFTIFTSLAIVIACLGLFGLAAYDAEQRTKEISIRKVLGADASAIVAMLSKNFLRLVLLSILLATPLAWWTMQEWLQDFAYREQIHGWQIALAGLAAILIAFITISFQSVKAANTNPINGLRSE